MIVRPIKTDKILPSEKPIFDVLDTSLTELQEGSVVAISSKIISLCESKDRSLPIEETDKHELIEKESDLYLPRSSSKYDVQFTIVNNTLVPNAGIDESNTNGHHVLWPKNSQKTANEIRDYLKNRFGLTKIGVIITDSTCTPMRWGTIGICLAHSGFSALNDYVGKPDLFGRKMQMSKANIAGDLATTTVMVMGEGAEQTPIATIEDIPFVEFQDRNPTREELEFLKIEFEDDLFAPFLKAVGWQKGKEKNT